jgi:DnaJ-class molecular chaperone
LNCPDCKGVGKTFGFGCPGFRPMELPCTNCDGTGQVDAAYVARKMEGERFRQARIERRETVRQCAIRLGVNPSKLSHYEHGRVVPDDILSKVRQPEVMR